MKDKCILVTGSSSGIGEAITTKLLDLGAKVFGIARDHNCLLYTSPSPRDKRQSRMPASA